MMQPLTDGPRAGYTDAQVKHLIENTSSPDVGMGVDLVDMDLNVIEEVTDWLFAGTVTRNNFAEIHGAATFSIDTPLDWGSSLVRPYMTMTGPISSTATTNTTMKFYQGVYFLDDPDEDLSQVPPTFNVTGYDILSLLDDAVGDDYSIAAGVGRLARVEEILQGVGITQYVIDQDAAAAVFASPRVWLLEENASWLTIVNDLLSGVGYQGVWTDWNGVVRCQTYDAPEDRAVEWVFSADVEDIKKTLLTQRTRRTRDLYRAPNRWVFYRSSNTDGPRPVDGDGRYEYINQTDGDTSVEARGRVITKEPEGVDVADQYSLEQYAKRAIAADMLRPTRITRETAPFPLAWHMDKYGLQDPALGAAMNVMGASWSKNLDGTDMVHEWTVVR